jgi:hypothetical protein
MRLSTPGRVLAGGLLGLAALFAAPAARAQTAAPAWQWAQRAGGPSFDYGNALVVDAGGNVYVTGFFSATCSFGPTIVATLSSRGSTDAYLAKYSHSGALLWVQQFGGAGNDNGLGLALDAAGNVYATGYFQNTATLGTGAATQQLTSAGDDDIYVAKFSPAGTLQWAQRGGGPSSDLGRAVAVDAAGNVYLTGRFTSSATLGGTTLSNSQNSISGSMLVARLNAAGTWQWAKGSTGIGIVMGDALALSPLTGEVYVVGLLQGNSATWDGTTLNPTAAGPLSFQGRLSPAGVWLTMKAVANGGSGFGSESVAIDAAGNVYQAGSFSLPTTLGTTTLTSVGSSVDGLVVKYSPAGAVTWARSFGGPGEDAPYSLALDPAGGVFMAGQFNGQSSFGGLTLNSPYPTRGDSWAGKLSAAGTWQWVQQAGGPGLDYFYGAATDVVGNLFVSGTYESAPMTAGTFTLSGSGQQDIFVGRVGSIPLATAAGLPRVALSAYPNPARGQTTIALEPGPGGVATVVDALGRTVREQVVGAGTRQLVLHLVGIPAGVYRVLLTGTGQRRTVPLVVE